MQKSQKAERNLEKFLENIDNVLSFRKMLRLNKAVKEQEAQLKKLRKDISYKMAEGHVDKLAGEVDGQVFVVTLSDGGNTSHRFNVESFKKDHPELYKKYSAWNGYTPSQLTIRAYKEPKNPCIACKAKEGCQSDCDKRKKYVSSKEEIQGLVDSLNNVTE